MWHGRIIDESRSSPLFRVGPKKVIGVDYLGRDVHDGRTGFLVDGDEQLFFHVDHCLQGASGSGVAVMTMTTGVGVAGGSVAAGAIVGGAIVGGAMVGGIGVAEGMASRPAPPYRLAIRALPRASATPGSPVRRPAMPAMHPRWPRRCVDLSGFSWSVISIMVKCQSCIKPCGRTTTGRNHRASDILRDRQTVSALVPAVESGEHEDVV